MIYFICDFLLNLDHLEVIPLNDFTMLLQKKNDFTM